MVRGISIKAVIKLVKEMPLTIGKYYVLFVEAGCVKGSITN